MAIRWKANGAGPLFLDLLRADLSTGIGRFMA
jgi:hypothetical protein